MLHDLAMMSMLHSNGQLRTDE